MGRVNTLDMVLPLLPWFPGAGVCTREWYSYETISTTDGLVDISRTAMEKTKQRDGKRFNVWLPHLETSQKSEQSGKL